jgi:hypothetical protein
MNLHVEDSVYIYIYIYKYIIPATTESNLFLAIQFPIHLILRACEYTPLG